MIPLGQFRDTFIIAVDDEGVAIIDQHVAHERVLFERLMETLTAGRLESQRLLVPMVMDLAPSAHQALVNRAAELERIGFEVESFGASTIKVTAVPALLKIEDGSNADPLPDRGLAAVRINYPYQAATLSGFRSSAPTDIDPLPPNISNVILADDGSVQQTNAPPGAPIDDSAVGAYAGPFGLGRQFALAGRTVRPFRKLISAQAIFRREAFE